MRIGLTLLALFLLSGCSALAVGGGTAGSADRGAGIVAADAAITRSITGQLATDTAVKPFKIGVRTYKGVVTLTGTTGNAAARNRAGYIAKTTKGAVAVNNLIVVGE